MNDMKINKKNKQREVFVSLQNIVLIPLNISVGISERKRLRWLSL